MPKSTATSWPSRVDEQIARMHVGVEEAVAQRVAQEGLDHACGRAPAGRSPRASSAARSCSGVPSIHSSVSTSARGAVPVDRRHAEVRIVLGVLRHLGERGGLEPQVHLERDRARAASRPSRSRRSRRASADSALGVRAREVEGCRDRAEAPLDAGPQHLHGDGLAAVGVDDLGAMHLRDRGGRDRRAERRDRPRSAACRAPPRPRLRPRPAGTAPSGPAALRDRAPARRRPRRAGSPGTGRA